MQTSKNPRKILIPAFDFKPALGGVAHYTHELTWALKQMGGVDVRIIARAMPDDKNYDAKSAFPVVRYSTSDTATLALPSWSRAIRAQLKDWHPDALLCPLWFPDAAAADLAQLAKGLDIRYSLVVHGMEVLPAPKTLKQQVREKMLAPLRNRVFYHSKKIFTVSRYSRDLTIRTTGADPRKIIVVNNGVNLQTFNKTSPSQTMRDAVGAKGKILLTVTRLHPYKGVDKVLEALPEVLKFHPDLKYVVVGTGPDRQRLDQIVERLSLQNSVVFLGAIEQSKIIDLYNTADLFVMLSREEGGDVEGFGLVFLEAAACGLPSLGGLSGGIPDAIEMGKSGWLIPPSDVPSIASKISQLLSDERLLSQASDYGLKMVQTRTWAAAARKVMEGLFG